MKNKFKFVLAAMVMAGFFFSALRTEAYPPFVRKAEKFGAKDCLFCHTQAGGGEGWNERGSWMIAEKDKRKADSIDVEWLADYKPEETKKEGEPAKEGEKKPAEKPPAAASAVDHSAHKSGDAAAKPATPAATGAVDHSGHNRSEAAAKPAASAATSETATTEKTAKVSKKPKTKLKKK